MFVFPAFNESYNKRKRTYKCCRKCRSRRVRCIIKDSNYEVTGCTNCSTSGIICDLIVDRERAQSEVENSNGSSLTFEDFWIKNIKVLLTKLLMLIRIIIDTNFTILLLNKSQKVQQII